MIKIEKVSYKALKQLSASDRLRAVTDPGIGYTLMSALTPSQIADLFPDYYRRRLPDISGFLQAIPSSVSAARQQYYDDQIAQTATGRAGLPMQGGALRDKLTKAARSSVSGAGRALPPPQLSPEQMSAIQALKQGNIAVDDPRMKFIANLNADQLKSGGIERISEGGRNVFHYIPVSVSEEEAKKSLQSSGSLKQMIDRAADKHGIDPRIMYGIVRGESGHGGQYDSNINSREESWGPFQMNRASWNPGLGAEFERETGRSVKDPSTLQMQADWIAKKIAQKGDGARHWVATQWYGYGSNVGGPHDFAARAAGGDAVWNPGWGSMGAARVSGAADGVLAPQQIAAEQRRMALEQETGRLGSLAEYTTAELGTQGDIRHGTDSGSTDASSIFARAESIARSSTGNSSFVMGGQNGGGQHACGVGARSMAGAMFNSPYFSQGLGHTGAGITAGSLSSGNAYFQQSGFYNNAIDPQGDLSDSSYRASLPVGTVISATKAGHAGHVQIKYGPGPNDWASDFDQKGKGGVLLHGYENFKVHIPNEAGQQALSSRGYAVTATPASVTREATNPNPAGVSNQISSFSSPDLAPQPDIRHPSVQPETPRSTEGADAPAPVAEKVEQKAKPQEKISAKATVSSGSYNVNVAQFREAIKKDPSNTYPGFMIDMASDKDIREGFNNDARVKAAGVHIDENWKMHVKDVNHPDVKDVIAGAQKQGALKAIEEKKKNEVKPGEAKADVKPTQNVVPAKPTENTQQAAAEMKSGGGFDIDRTMAIIRRQESGSFAGDYSADAAKRTKGKMTASGAYQFNNKTWGAVTKKYNIGTEYKRAVDAPQNIQDSVMRARIEDLYKKHGSLEKVLMTHFTGNAAGRMSASAIKANRGLTGPQYVASIIQQHAPEYDKMQASKNVTATTENRSITPTPAVMPVSYKGPEATTGTPAITPNVSAKDRIAPTVAPTPDRQHEVRNELNNIRQEMQVANSTDQRQITPRSFSPTVGDNEPNMIGNMMMQTQTAYSNPTAERALGARPNFSETGDARQHFSIGNTA